MTISLKRPVTSLKRLPALWRLHKLLDAHLTVFKFNPAEAAEFRTALPRLLEENSELWLEDAARGFNPWLDVHRYDGVIVLRERCFYFGWLQPQTIIDWHMRNDYLELDDINEITINRSGMHLYRGRQFKVATLQACRLDPHRLADDGSRLKNAACLIEHYTGVATDWQEFLGKYSVTYVRCNNGSWEMKELSTDQATA